MTVARLEALHARPRWPVVFREQVRATGMVLRTLGALLLPLFLILAGAAIRAVAASRKLNDSGAGRVAMYFSFTPRMSLLCVFFALVLPLIVWQDEDPSRRLYHHAMPVSRVGHASLKSAAGLLWLMFATVLFLLGVATVQVILDRMGMPQPYDRGFTWWEWLVPFTSLAVAYLFSSAAAVGTRRPVIWIFTPIVLFVLIGREVHEMYFRRLDHALQRVVTGYYGAAAALGGNVGVLDLDAHAMLPSLVRWLGATAIWGSAGAAVFYLAARRRTDA